MNPEWNLGGLLSLDTQTVHIFFLSSRESKRIEITIQNPEYVISPLPEQKEKYGNCKLSVSEKHTRSYYLQIRTEESLLGFDTL